VNIGRLKPSPQSARCEPSDAIVELALVVLKLPNVISGRMSWPCIRFSAVCVNASWLLSNVAAGSRYSPKLVALMRMSTTVLAERTVVKPPVTPVLLR